MNIMERYVTTTYRLHELHICAQGWYVTTTYHLYTNNRNNVIYVYEIFSLEILVCWRRAWYVLLLRERLSTSLADVLRQWLHWMAAPVTRCCPWPQALLMLLRCELIQVENQNEMYWHHLSPIEYTVKCFIDSNDSIFCSENSQKLKLK